jgi:hypothetical protein
MQGGAVTVMEQRNARFQESVPELQGVGGLVKLPVLASYLCKPAEKRRSTDIDMDVLIGFGAQQPRSHRASS